MAQLQPLPLLAACIRDSQAMPQARPVLARGYPSHPLCRSVLAMSPSLNETDSQREFDSQQYIEAVCEGRTPSSGAR